MALAILVSLVAFFFGLLNLAQTGSLILLLAGLWTIVAAFSGMSIKDRNFYAGWGVALVVLSLFVFLPPQYTIGLLLIALVILILENAYGKRAADLTTSATSPPPPASDTPAAISPRPTRIRREELRRRLPST